MVKGLIYDLDGTIIDTEDLHRETWISTCHMFGVIPTEEMLFNQKGMPGDAASRMMLSPDKHHLAGEFLETKEAFAIENLDQVSLYSGFTEAYKAMTDSELPIWICTSALQNFVKSLLEKMPELKPLEGRIVWREMYDKGKPNPDPLFQTLDKIGLNPQDVPYVGDVNGDFLAATNAGMEFIYFCPDKRDERIPKDVRLIKDHRDILHYI